MIYWSTVFPWLHFYTKNKYVWYRWNLGTVQKLRKKYNSYSLEFRIAKLPCLLFPIGFVLNKSPNYSLKLEITLWGILGKNGIQLHVLFNWPWVANPAFCSAGTYNRAEILRLRRRFLKDREKLSLLYAKKGLVEQKLEKVCILFMDSVPILHTDSMLRK